MTEVEAQDSPQTGSPRTSIRFDLNGVILEIPDFLITKLIADNIPDFLQSNSAHTAKERVVRLTMKGAMRVFLGYVEGQIVEKGADLPLPTIPVDDAGDEHDVLEYGVYYILALGLAVLSRTDIHADVEEQDDGTLRVVQLTAASTELAEAADDASLGAGKDAQSGVTIFTGTAAPSDPPTAG